MYPISFIFDSLRNDIRRFDTTIEASTHGSLELTRIVDRVSTAETTIAKYIKASLVVLGLGLLSVAENSRRLCETGRSFKTPAFVFGHRSADVEFS
jgi:hypothetical protein